jgi:hypothetical protein
MFLNIGFELSPIAFVIAYLFAGRANGKHCAQGFDLSEGVLKFE